jgi:mannobiose 2-epimerase
MRPTTDHARALAAGALLFCLACSPATAQPARPDPAEVAKLRAKVEELLTSELTTRWYPRALDRDLGGFHQSFARDWSPRPDADRFLVYQARVTWTAAAFARFSPRHRDEFEGYARHGVAYLDATMRDADRGGFHFILDPRGQVDPKLGDEKHVYGTAFVLYAASAAREATGDDRALKVARDAFDWLERHAHDKEHGGYFEAIARDGKPIFSYDPEAPPWQRADRLGVYHGFKSMNSHIHLLEALAEFSKVERTPIVAERLRETLAIVRDKVAVEPGALNLYFTRDWRPAPAHDSFGHDVETAYLLIEAAEALGEADDARTRRVARSLVDHALDFGWDDEHGGFYDKGDVFAGRAYDTTKVWWTQAEGLNALLLMHTLYGETTDRYWNAFLKQWDFISKHQLDSDHGGWFGDVTREGKLLGDGAKASPWKANYHTSRALMNVATMLRRLEKDANSARGDK